MLGLHPVVVRLADRMADAGMTAYLPSLSGELGRPISTFYVLKTLASVIWIRREFTVRSIDRSSPIVEWLRVIPTSADVGHEILANHLSHVLAI